MSNKSLEKGGVQVVARIAAIFRSLESEPAGLSLGAISQRSELPRSTVQRLVDTLAQEGLLEVQGRGGITLGPAFMKLASHSHVDISQKARPYLERLSQETGETAILAGMSGYELIILHSVASANALRVVPVAGSFLNIYATSSGKALLAHLADQTIIELISSRIKQLTPATPDLPHILQSINASRKTGFFYEFNEHIQGVGAIAVGLPTTQGNYAIEVVGPAWRVEESRSSIQALLADCRNELLKALRSFE